jgi:hypothetical protein
MEENRKFTPLFHKKKKEIICPVLAPSQNNRLRELRCFLAHPEECKTIYLCVWEIPCSFI